MVLPWRGLLVVAVAVAGSVAALAPRSNNLAATICQGAAGASATAGIPHSPWEILSPRRRRRRRGRSAPPRAVRSSRTGDLEDTPKKIKHVVVVGGGVGGLAVACRLVARQQQQQQQQQQQVLHGNVRGTTKSPSYVVTVLEKNDEVGGRCGSFFVDVEGHGTFRHERGPSLLLLPDHYRQLFEECGLSLEECGLHLKTCNPAYQVVFDDGDRVQLGFRRTPTEPLCAEAHDNAEIMEDESRQALDAMEPNGAQKWDEYLRACEAYLDCGLPNFIEQRLDLASLPRFLLESLRDGARAWPLQPHSAMLDNFFESTKMRALASFQDLYVGLEPYDNPTEAAGGVFTSTAPAVFGLLAAIEMHPTNAKCGVYAPVGGFGAVTSAVETLARKVGVRIRCGQTVTKVTNEGVHVVGTSEGGAAATEPEFIRADLVVVNADVPYAQHSLTRPDGPEGRAAYDWSPGAPGRPRYRFSSGVVAFHWSTSQVLHDLSTHNVFLVASNRTNADRSWQVVREGGSSNRRSQPTKGNAEPFNFYVHRASPTDPTAAPKGRDAILVLVPCETLRRDPSASHAPRAEAMATYAAQFHEERVASIREAVLHRLAAIPSLRNLKDWIVHEVVDTPATYADKYHVAAGSPFGLSHGLGQLSLTRPGARSSSMTNVLHVGASARPGNGVPLVLIGAKLTADLAGRMLEKQS